LSVKIVLPTALARHTDGQKSFDSEAENLPGLLAEFDTKFPALAQNVKLIPSIAGGCSADGE